MNKTLKFALVFVLLCGCIALAYNWKNWFGPTPTDEGSTIVDVHNPSDIDTSTYYGKLEYRIASDWENTRAWNEDMYVSEKNHIIQYKNQHLIDEENAIALRQQLRETSIARVCNLYDLNLKNATFRRDSYKDDVKKLTTTLQNNYQGLKYILKDNGVDTTFRSRAVEICAMHGLYLRLNKFQPIVSSLYKESENNQLGTLYQSRLNEKKTDVSNFKKDGYYNKMSHLFDGKLDSVKHNKEFSFYQQLIDNIKKYYKDKYTQHQSDTTRLRKNRNLLNNAISHLPTQYDQADLNALKNNYDDILNPKNP